MTINPGGAVNRAGLRKRKPTVPLIFANPPQKHARGMKNIMDLAGGGRRAGLATKETALAAMRKKISPFSVIQNGTTSGGREATERIGSNP